MMDWLLSRDRRNSMAVNLTPAKDEEEKAKSQQIGSLQAQLAKYKIRDRQTYEEEKSKDKDEIVIKDLEKQQYEINKENEADTISFGKVFYALMNNDKFRKTLELMDKDDKTKFGIFGDIQINKRNGNLMLKDSEFNTLIEGTTLSQIIYKPETLDNQLKRGRILLPVDENRKRIPDLEKIYLNEIHENEEGDMEETVAFTETAKQMLIDRDSKINEYYQYIERLERSQIKLEKELLETKQANRLYKNQVDVTKSSFSEATNTLMQINTQVSEMSNKIAHQAELIAYFESKNTVMETVIQNLLKKIEQAGDKTLYEQVKEEVHTDLELYKNVLPEKIIEMNAPEKEVRPPTRAGQVLETPKII